MRRFLLILTGISFAVWSQAPQQPQPPIVVQIQTPPANPWMRLVELVIPGIIGASLAFFGVWLTNRRNAAENKANREHQLQVEIAKAKIAAKHRSRDNQWEFRKDVYVKLLTAAAEMKNAVDKMASISKKYKQATQITPLDARHRSIRRIAREMLTIVDTFDNVDRQLDIYSNIAPLAIADDVLPLLSALQRAYHPDHNFELDNSEAFTAWTQTWQTVVNELLQTLQENGRKALWSPSESEAKAETAKQP